MSVDTESQAGATRERPAFRILIIGVGGGGCNAVSNMGADWQAGPETVAIHTDAQALAASGARRRIQIGAGVTHGHSSGGDAVLGRQAAEADGNELRELFVEVDLAFLIVGLGGGTGTGAAPVLAELARDMGALTLCFATLPFGFEGEHRRQQAEDGLRALQQAADMVIALPNQRLFDLIEDKTSLVGAFRKVDEIMGHSIRSIWNLLLKTGVINLDFADLRSLVRQSGGTCTLAYAEGSGRKRAQAAAEAILNSPFFDGGRVISQAGALLVGITGGPEMTLLEVEKAMNEITSRTRPDARTIMGTAVDEEWRNRFAMTVLASESFDPEVDSGVEVIEEKPKASAGSGRVRGGKADAGRGKRRRARQTRLKLEPVGRGRFKDVEPTLHEGEDLDIPTFMRRGIKLSR